MTLEQLSKIYYQKYLVPLVGNSEIVREYNFFEPQDREELITLYEFRNDNFKEKNGSDNIKFKSLINELKMCKDANIIMHVVEFASHPCAIWTTVDFTEVVGQL